MERRNEVASARGGMDLMASDSGTRYAVLMKVVIEHREDALQRTNRAEPRVQYRPTIPHKSSNTTLVFHAVVATTLSTQPDSVMLGFCDSRFGNVVMEHSRAIDEKTMLFEGIAHISIKHYERQRFEKEGLKYRYSILMQDANEIVHEKEMGDRKGEKIRHIKIPRNLGAKELHQYDGTIHCINKFVDNLQNLGANTASGLDNRIKNEKKLLEDANAKAVLAFVPSIYSLTANPDFPVAGIIERISQVSLCAKDWFIDVEGGHDWFVDVEGGHVNTHYYIHVYLQRELEQLIMSKRTPVPSNTNGSLVQAMAIVYLLSKYNLQLRHGRESTNRLLFISLLLKAESGTLDEDLQLIRHHFYTELIQEELCNYLTKYIIQNKTHLLHEWIYAVPIIINLSPKTLNRNALADALLGLETLKTIKQHLDDDIRFTHSSLMECVYALSYLFDKDPLLPKVVMDYLSFDQVAQLAENVYFPPEYLFVKYMSYIRLQPAPDKHVESVKAKIYGWAEQLNVTRIDNEKLLQLFSIGVRCARDLFSHQHAEYRFRHDVRVTIDVITSLGSACYKAKYTEKRTNKLNALWDTLLQNILGWLKKDYPVGTVDISNTLEVLEYLLSVQMPRIDLHNLWSKEITRHLDACLRRFSPEKKMQMYCNLRQVCTRIEQCFQTVAIDAIEQLPNEDLKTLPRWLDEPCLKQNPRAITLVGTFFKTWFQRQSDKSTLETMLEYSPFITCWQLLHKPKIILGDNITRLLIKCKESIGVFIHNLEKRSVKLASLMYVIHKKDRFYQIYHKIYGQDYRGLEENIHDFQEFRELNRNIRHILSVCTKGLVDVAHRSLDDFKHMSISTAWCRNDNGVMVIPVYNVSPTLMKSIPSVAGKLHITSFSKIFNETCQNLQTKYKLSLEEVLIKVWPKAETNIKLFVRKLIDGSIKLASIDIYFGDFRKNIRGLETELMAIDAFDGGVHKDTINERCKQITMYFCRDSLQATADIYLQLRDTLQLSGNFQMLTRILKTFNFHDPLKDITISVIPTDLFAVTPVLNVDEIRCLETFINCIDLARWMKAELKGPQGIKRLAELAMSSAEDQGDCEVEKLSNLLAIVAYGPLMFELHTSAGYKELTVNCKYVLKTLKTDPNLPNKMISTQDNFKWLESVHESISSTETNSLDTAVHILQHGQFSIGNIRDQENIKILDDVQLVYLSKLQKRCKKPTYNLVELKDLNSKLVLTTGPSHEYYEQAAIFGELYDMLTRIGKCYVRLCEIGCILFQNMVIRFHCNNECGIVQIDMKLKDIGEVRRSDDSWNGVLEILKEIDKNLNSCLDKMLADITERRNCFSELNYFTTKQLSVLRRELVKLNRWFFSKPQMDDIYPILYCIKQNCTYEDLKMCMDRSENVIKQYIFKEVCCRGRKSLTKHPYIVADGLPKLPPRTLGALFKVWGAYTTQYDDGMITLEQLGLFFKQLGQMGTENKERSLQSPFVKGRPNLVVCPQGEMYERLLSIYMYEHGARPSDHEVLLCTPETTDEEVNLLFRRCVGSSTRMGIYCLVNADRLEYSVANSTLQQLSQLSAGTTDYQLVVLCSQENENKALYVSALDKYRINTPYKQSREDIRQYVQKILRVTQVATIEPRPLASLDSERSAVRVLKSDKAGCGKTLRKKRLQRQAQQIYGKKLSAHTIAVHGRSMNNSQTRNSIVEATGHKHPSIIHIDVAHEVEHGLDNFLFNSIILGCLKDENGRVWRRRQRDFILVENVPLLKEETGIYTNSNERRRYVHQMLELLPSTQCLSPSECQLAMANNNENQLYDQDELQRGTIQRPCWYLDPDRTDDNTRAVYMPTQQYIEPVRCVNILLRHCGINDPSWAELGYFAKFLNEQLKDCEKSVYCSQMLANELPGFRDFVVRFMIQMSKDFATRSLEIAEETRRDSEGAGTTDTVAGFEMKRKWENSPHPYIVFNKDGTTMTFLGFNIDESTLDLVDLHSGDVLEHNIMTRELYDGLTRQRVNMSENMHDLQQEEKLDKLRRVLGVSNLGVDDKSYELTMDNLKKILAIDMRFRCGIPVVIMGETGCGKTRLVEYMCNIKKPKGIQAQTMIILKVHGGTTEDDITCSVKQALQVAQRNKTRYDLETVLFFDEANATEAIGLIQEIMCSRTMNGRPLENADCLRLVATCNPYRRHSDDMVKKLEEAGLGYHTSAGEAKDKLGRIPMRRLVYRVQPLPHSMIPLVWDFGQLSDKDESLYIKQIVNSFICEGADGRFELKLEIESTQKAVKECISAVLTASQQFMRLQEDECSFVSLRNVKRVLKVMDWFYQHRQLLFEKVDEKFSHRKGTSVYNPPNDITRCIVYALAVCYHSCLQNTNHRARYRQTIGQHLTQSPCQMHEPVTDSILWEIQYCQEVFLDELHLGPNIAKNNALRENVFMMVVCIELRIPLFLVGKPGSSKSLARSIVTDAMQGNASISALYRELKDTSMLSFQCSPLSTSEGIISTFRQCANLQQKRDVTKFASIVILEEVGLAEDSPSMPLKTLHPLLEEGAKDDDGKLQKVGFIGISNWALDPAKMNRGILVQRCVPDGNELFESAMSICASDISIRTHIEELLEKLSSGYMTLNQKIDGVKEFFGLRDFYSLIKMVYDFAARNNGTITMNQLLHAIKRNFSGLETIYHVTLLTDGVTLPNEQKDVPVLDNSDIGLIKANLKGDYLDIRSDEDCPSRYLLLLTENNAALTILDQHLLDLNDTKLIYGSSFPRDLEYTQVCRNINRIKLYMATGKTVVLINADHLYESLYDVLNQYYETLGNSQFVSLGLGTHRVKCKVHKDFRLILVAERAHVYKRFPIPLINRLEKHFLAMSTILTDQQQHTVQQLELWMERFACPPQIRGSAGMTVADAFIGYYKDAASAVVLELNCQQDTNTQDTQKAQEILLRCATPEAVLNQTNDSPVEWTIQAYFEHQEHSSLQEFLKSELSQSQKSVFAQVLTHSKLLSIVDSEEVANVIGFETQNIITIGLQKFNTEQEFCKEISGFFKRELHTDRLLILQCFAGNQYAELIACSRHLIVNEYENIMDQQGTTSQQSGRIHVVFLIQLPKKAGGCFNGYQGGRWQTIFIDELRPDRTNCPPWIALHGVSLSSLFENGLLEDDPNKGFTRRYTCDLIRKCIHAAGSCVIDSKATDDERLNRVQKVVSLIDNFHIKDAALEFKVVFLKRIIVLMREREQLSIYPADWLMRDVADLEKVTNAGTLRKSLQMCLESKITPLLAGLMALLSSNNTLQIPPKASDPWVRHLWLAMFNDPDITTYRYEEIRTAYNGTELTQMNVTHYWQYPFDTRFPFSHLIKEHLEYLMHTCKHVEDGSTTMANAFESSRLGKLLAAVIPSNCTKAIDMFMYDFVRHIYKPITNVSWAKELKVVSDAIHAASGLARKHYFAASLCDLYQAYCKLRVPIQNFKMLLEVDRLHIMKVLQRWTDNSHMRLDVQALHLIVKFLKSETHERLQDVHTWIKRFKKYNSVIEKAVAYIESDTAFGADKRFTKTKSDWTILQTAYLFVECVMVSSKEATKIFKSKPGLLVKELTSIDVPLDFKHDKLIKAVTTFIAKCTSSVESQQLRYDVAYNLQKAMDSFIVQLVSQHCFRGPMLPEKEAIDRFMNYITKKSGRSIFPAKGLKPTPVVRFFFLQLLLRYRSEEVQEYLQQYFNEKLSTRNLKHQIQIIRIAVHCFEDSIETRVQAVENTAEYTWRWILEAKNGLFTRDVVEQISAIAKTRYSFWVLADWLYQHRHESNFTKPELHEARALCAKCIWPGQFLVKVIGRKYGVNVLKSLLAKPNLEWMIPEGVSILQGYNLRDDRFVVYGQDYRNIREFFMGGIVDGNFQKLITKVFKTSTSNTSRCKMLILVVCRLNILCYFHDAIPQQQLQLVENHMKKCDVPPSTKNLIKTILNNAAGSDLLRTSATLPDSDRHLSLVEIVVHFKAVFFTNDVKPVLRLFKTLLFQPEMLRSTYLPTMSEDAADLVRNAMKGEKMWLCPNGHRYMVGECGKPVQNAKCHCGADIGGKYHKPESGNVQESGLRRDETKTGHILGRASNRSNINESERSLSPAKVSVIRLLMHIAMFIGAETHPQDICKLLNFNISPRDVGKEMWSHMVLDLSILTNTLQVSLDDCCLFIHRLLMNMTRAHPSADSKNSKYRQTTLTKDERYQWENDIDNLFLKQAFVDKDRLIAEDNAVISNDKQNADRKLRNIVFESSNHNDDVDISRFYDSPVLWKYRKSISLQHFKDSVYSAEERTLAVAFLKQFLKMENQLKWVRFIPSIEKLHIFLSQKFYAKLGRMEAKNMTIKDFLRAIKGQQLEEIEKLVHIYFEVWNALRYDIKQTGCPETCDILDAYLDHPLSVQSSLNYLLPGTRDEGTCALGLMAYLCRIHNDFIEEYATLTRTPCTVSVNLKDVTHAHVIGFETAKDVLPIILANCNYSFHEEHNSVDFSYDFDSVSRKMEQRFLHGKPRILFEPELIVFITELTNTLRFQQLEDRVPQENLSKGIKQQIQTSSQDLADFVDLLTTLDVAIGFIITIRPDKDKVIGDFIMETLDTPFPLTELCNDKCQLKHVKSLWIFLSQLKAQILTLNGHDPFDSVDPKYKEPLAGDQVQNLHNALRQANMGVFVSELYQCIILQITIKQNENDDDYVDNAQFPLGIVLGEYTEVDIPIVDGVFPQDITASQCIETWCEAFKHSLRYDN